MKTHVAPMLVDIGGRRLATKMRGDGVPLVVLEMGLGGEGSMYDAIAQQMATFTQVLWYDRAGLGQSDPAPTPRTIRELVLDLHALLQKMALPGPYLLAGHSMGGPVVRCYRECYPEEVAALVLIDSSHEDQRDRQLALLPPRQSDELPGLTRLRHGLEVRWADPNANEEKIDNLANSQFLRTCRSLGDLPLAVISRGRSNPNPVSYPADLAEAMEQEWRQMQCELVQLSSQSHHIIATGSWHLINEDEPALIVEVIRQMTLQVRDQMKRVHIPLLEE